MLIWEYHNKQADHYELRRAGGSVRLYRNGIFHSQCHGQRLANGGVWDLLWLPVLLMRASRVRRVLLLGVGLGAALHKLKWLYPETHFVAVDNDPVHLALAATLLKDPTPDTLATRCRRLRPAELQAGPVTSGSEAAANTQTGVELIQADAIDWLLNYRGPRFDVIIDDLYIDHCERDGPGQPSRVIELDHCPATAAGTIPQRHAWLATLQKRLQGSGLIVANCASAAAVTRAAELWQSRAFLGYSAPAEEALQRRGACQFTTPQFANRILLLGRDHIESQATHCVSGERWHSTRGQLADSLAERLEQAAGLRVGPAEQRRLLASVSLRSR